MNDYLLRLGRRRYDYNPHVHGVFIDNFVSNEFWGVQNLWATCAFHPSGNSEHIAVLGDEEGQIGIIDVRKCDLSSEFSVDDDDMLCPSWLLKSFKGHRAVVMDLCFLPADPTKLITSSGDEKVKVWDVERSQALFDLHGHEKSVRGVACWETDANTFATGGRDGTICIWDIREPPTEVCVERKPANSISDAHARTTLHADVGKTAPTKAVPTPPRRIKRSTLHPVVPIGAPSITSLVYIDDHLLVSGSSTLESGLGVWDLRSGVSQQISKPVRVCKFPDAKLGRGKGVATLCVDRARFGLYAATTDGSVHEFLLNDLTWRCDSSFSETPQMFVPRTTIRRSRIVPARREYTGTSKNGFYARVAASPLSDHILCSYLDGAIRIWDTKEKSQRITPSHTLPGHNGEITDLAWSKRGNYILALDDQKPILWNCRTEYTQTSENGSRRYTAQMHNKAV